MHEETVHVYAQIKLNADSVHERLPVHVCLVMGWMGKTRRLYESCVLCVDSTGTFGALCPDKTNPEPVGLLLRDICL